MDLRALIGEVAARNQIRLEEDDPAFALVTLNQLVLEQTVAELVQQVRASMAEFEQSATRLQGRLGGVLAQELKRALATAQPPHYPILSRAATNASTAKWMSLGAVAALGCFVLGFAVGCWVQ
jgi:hypothetical protein